jgi:hypothetical protein
MTRLRERLFAPVDVAGLVAFRVLFGLLMAWEYGEAVFAGVIERRYVQPSFLFKYLYFEWVRPLPSWGMYVVFVVAALCGLAISAGLLYRAAAVAFFACHTYVFLLSPEHYLNHTYLIAVLSLLLVLSPAHRALSLDAVLRDGLYSRRIPAWPYWSLLFLLSCVFFFGGVAKINADWLAGAPLGHWFAHLAKTSFLGGLLRSGSVVMFVAWGGMIFDLMAPALLLWKRTRPIGVAVSVFFHLTNAHLFDIGIFPWLMLAATTLFLDPSWPRKLPGIGETIGNLLDDVGAPIDDALDEPAIEVPPEQQRRISKALVVFAGIMIVLPLRHRLYPGDVAWTEDGHYLSWRMMLRSKTGSVEYRVRNRGTGEEWTVKPTTFLNKRQVSKLVGKPDLILQFAHFLRDRYGKSGGEVEVRADAFASLNFRATQRYVDPDVDLAQVRPSLLPYHWVVPFENTPIAPPGTKPRDPDEPDPE